jgi:hypothetical protein
MQKRSKDLLPLLLMQIQINERDKARTSVCLRLIIVLNEKYLEGSLQCVTIAIQISASNSGPYKVSILSKH